MDALDCLTVGAGMAGLMAARELAERGWNIAVVDKGRGVGGRMATRRWDNAVFDHGAQFLTAHEPAFAACMDSWMAAGVVKRWTRGFLKSDLTRQPGRNWRCRGAPGMTAVCKHLAGKLAVETGVRLMQISQERGAWRAESEDGRVWRAKRVLLTPPVPQSLALLASGGTTLPQFAREALTAIEYEPCIAVLARPDGPSGLPEPGLVQVRNDVIDIIADNRIKGVSPVEAITIHATGEYSRDHWDRPVNHVAQKILKAAQAWLKTEVRDFQTMKWRYSKPIAAHPQPFLAIERPGPAVFAGDAFGPRSRVETAALSGLAAAHALLSMS